MLSQHVCRIQARDAHRALHALHRDVSPGAAAFPSHPPGAWSRAGPRPVLRGFAALRNASPASSPRKLPCSRAERGTFASLWLSRGTEPFNVNGTRHPKPSAGRGRAAWAEGEHIPHRLHPPLPALSLPRAAAQRGGQRHLAGPGMGNQPPQAPPAPSARGPRAPLPAAFPSPGTAAGPCLKDADRQKLT